MIMTGTRLTSTVELAQIPLPLHTRTYKPVGHAELVDMVKDIATQTITGYKLIDEAYAIGKNGAEMFGYLIFHPMYPGMLVTKKKDMTLAIGLVNSYNKRVRVKFASGAQITESGGLIFLGTVTYMRKHTPNVITDVTEYITSALTKAADTYETAVADSNAMKYVELNNERAHALLGILFGQQVLNTPQLNLAIKQWNKPTNEMFKPRTLWTLYHIVSTVMKNNAPALAMERHITAHETLVDCAKHRSII